VNENDIDYARRDLVGAVALGLAAGAAPSGATPSTSAAPLSDPTTKFPRPPFPNQQQPWPGLASKMGRMLPSATSPMKSRTPKK
jgi:hypothetical protein